MKALILCTLLFVLSTQAASQHPDRHHIPNQNRLPAGNDPSPFKFSYDESHSSSPAASSSSSSSSYSTDSNHSGGYSSPSMPSPNAEVSPVQDMFNLKQFYRANDPDLTESSSSTEMPSSSNNNKLRHFQPPSSSSHNKEPEKKPPSNALVEFVGSSMLRFNLRRIEEEKMKALMKEESRLRSKKRKLAIKQPVTANSSLRDTAYAGQHSAKPPAPGKKRKLDMHKLKIGPKTSAEKRTRFDVSYKIPKRMPQTHVYSVQTRPRKYPRMEEPAFRYYLLLLGQHLHDVSHRWQTIAQEMAAVGHPYTPERLRRTMFYAIDYTKRKIRRYEKARGRLPAPGEQVPMDEQVLQILWVLYDKDDTQTRAFIDGKRLHEAVLHRRAAVASPIDAPHSSRRPIESPVFPLSSPPPSPLPSAPAPTSTSYSSSFASLLTQALLAHMHKEPQESSPLLFHNNSPVATPSIFLPSLAPTVPASAPASPSPSSSFQGILPPATFPTLHPPSPPRAIWQKHDDKSPPSSPSFLSWSPASFLLHSSCPPSPHHQQAVQSQAS